MIGLLIGLACAAVIFHLHQHDVSGGLLLPLMLVPIGAAAYFGIFGILGAALFTGALAKVDLGPMRSSAPGTVIR